MTNSAIIGPTLTEMQHSILASGYALEARLSEFLTKQGYDVESNIAFQDPITKVSREIDLLANPLGLGFVAHEPEVYVDYRLVIEAINNTSPLVFFSGSSYPYSGLQKLRMRVQPSNIDDHIHFVHLLEYQCIPHQLDSSPCTQYCTFVKKKSGDRNHPDRWMAFHADDLFETFKKLLFFSDHQAREQETGANRVNSQLFALEIIQPLLVIQGHLFIATSSKRSIKLKHTGHVVFEFRHHYLSEPSFLLIDVITERFLPRYLNMIHKEAKRLGNDIQLHVVEKMI